MSKCKLCGGKIQAKTAAKYHGYSRQCLEKVQEEQRYIEKNLPYYLEKLQTIRIGPVFYHNKEEYGRIWGIPRQQQQYFYERYLNNTIQALINAIEV